jgi:single-strand DNA-binding protein
VFDTNVVIVGNVLTAPEWRKTNNSGHVVANFRVASTSRRFDRETGRWVDGNSLRVRVVCWRKLAEGIAASLTVGDPVVVTGRLYTRDWTDSDNNPRTSYEMEAVAVGHDLARGRGRFYRNRPAPTSGVEAEGQVRGEAAELLPEDEVPAGYGDGIPDEEPPMFEEAPGELDAVARLRGGGFGSFDNASSPLEAVPAPPEGPDAGAGDAAEVGSAGISPVDELEAAVEAAAEDAPRRSRRGSRRQPVAA